MKKFFKRLFMFVLCLAIAFCLVRFGPNIYERLFGSGNAQWISERFSETLKEKNELVVYEVETTGQETVSQDAWLIGTVQKVEMPYTFTMNFVVDLSRADVSAQGNAVIVRVPSPKAAYAKLTVDEEKMKKSDWLYPLTPERYASIKQQVEDRLYTEYSTNTEYIENAWGVTVKSLENLLKSVAELNQQEVSCEIRVVRDDTLTQEATDAPQTTEVANAA